MIGCGGLEQGDNLVEDQDEIIGGATDTGDPAVVALFTHQPAATSGFLCTGTIISATKILTAAHCVDPAVIGTGNIHEVLLGTPAGADGTLAVSAAVFDPAFNVNNLTAGHDVAVVTLASPTTITPIAFNQSALGSGTTTRTTRIIGYGTNNHTGGGAGTKRVASTRVNSFDSLLLSIGSTNRQTCHGDSGGPALQVIGGVETVIGVTSFGQDLSFFQCFGGGFDTRIDTYSAFINANL